jgi:alpha-1,2-mannosyltransferase
MANLVPQLRSGDFLTRERLTLLAGGLLLGYVLSLLFLGLTAHGMNDYAGRPLGTDFSNVYAAGVAAAGGDATAPFDVHRQLEMERHLFGAATPFYGWHYPPFFLFVAMALAKIPYLAALILWQGVTLLLYLSAIALLLRKSGMPDWSWDRQWLLATLGFAAVFLNLIHGQNGFLTTALFASALALLDERPLLAGILFGLTCYKPQFAVVIPLALTATGRWRALGAACATGLLLSAAVTAVFGWEVWPAFAESMRFTRLVVLEQGNTGFYKIQSLFAAVRLWGGSIALAYAAQVLLALTVATGLLQIWRGSGPMTDKKSALCLAALLITPYCRDYDLVLLAPVVALSAAQGRTRGFADYELLSLALLWLAPAVTRSLAHYALIPFALGAMLISFASIWRRGRGPRNARLPASKSPFGKQMVNEAELLAQAPQRPRERASLMKVPLSTLNRN